MSHIGFNNKLDGSKLAIYTILTTFNHKYFQHINKAEKGVFTMNN